MSAPKVGSALRSNLVPHRAADIMRSAARSLAEQRDHLRMTEVANAQSSLDALSELVPLYFHRLKSTSAIAAFLLLNTFALQRETEELRESRLELEETIATLKSRVAELEDAKTRASSRGEQNQVSALSAENARLRLAQAELRRINQQWALDYEALVQQAATRGEQPHPPTDDKHSQLEQRIEQLMAELATHAQSSREAGLKMRLLEDEKRAMEIQLQELGTLDEVLAWKSDASRLRTMLKQKDQQYQEVIAINIETRKQLQKLQQAFLHMLVSKPTKRPSVLNLKNSRRPNHAYPPPSTPPGLLSRDVEKDLPAQSTSGTGSQLSDLLVSTLACPGCSRVMEGTHSGYHQWCEHVKSCGN